MIGISSRKGIARILPLIAALAVLFGLSACSSHIGYGVMNWSLPEHNLSAGDVVPVFIQSNISKVYVIGVGKGARTHVEVPLWQLKLYKSRSKAHKAAAVFGEYRYTYATVNIDGLPIRATPENTARQVYRLRENQKVKIIRKGEGTPVLMGNSPLEGDWFEIMTDDGGQGWCFSYNLTLFDERQASPATATASGSGADSSLDNLLARAWYPDSYRTMIADDRIDLDRIDLQWGFFPGKDAGVARVQTAEGLITFPYTAIVKADEGLYRFEGSTLTVQIRKSDSILVQYSDSNGMPHALYFSSLDIAPADLIATEKSRRADLIAEIVKRGPGFSSGNYGVIRFLEDGRFLWSGYQLLTPSVIPAGSGSGGMVDVRCFLPNGVAPEYDGVLSFKFENARAWTHFLYAVSGKGLKLESLSESSIKDNVVTARSLSPTVIFFTPGNSGSGGS